MVLTHIHTLGISNGVGLPIAQRSDMAHIQDTIFGIPVVPIHADSAISVHSGRAATTSAEHDSAARS
eukprot:1292991-Pyramimonas_sp.AAC.1